MFDYIDESERRSYIIDLKTTGKLCQFCDNEMEHDEQEDIIYWKCTCGNFEETEI